MLLAALRGLTRGLLHLSGSRTMVRAKFDAAKRGTSNRRHWTDADVLSPTAALTPAVRREMRMRVRHERANNSDVAGLALTVASDMFAGLRVQFRTGNDEADLRLSELWQDWADETNLVGKFISCRVERIAGGGEAFGAFTTNRRLRSPIKLDIRLYEADQIETPDFALGLLDERTSGIEFDDQGHPTHYHVLKSHPGGNAFAALAGEYVRVPVEQMFHYFRADRPGQTRGIPELTPAIETIATLRRYQEAVVKTAEDGASRAIVFETDTVPDEEDETDSKDGEGIKPLDTLGIEHVTGMFLPHGWKAKGFDAKQPMAGYADFTRAVKATIGRCLGLPVNLAIGDSSKSNYASAQLDQGNYLRIVDMEREQFELQVADRVVAKFLDEAVLRSELWGSGRGKIPDVRRQRIDWRCMYKPFPHADPVKHQKARETAMRAGLELMEDLKTRDGVDGHLHLKRLGDQERKFREHGIPSMLKPGAAGVGGPAHSIDEHDEERDGADGEGADQDRSEVEAKA